MYIVRAIYRAASPRYIDIFCFCFSFIHEIQISATMHRLQIKMITQNKWLSKSQRLYVTKLDPYTDSLVGCK